MLEGIYGIYRTYFKDKIWVALNTCIFIRIPFVHPYSFQYNIHKCRDILYVYPPCSFDLVVVMVLILNGNTEIGDVRRHLCYLICFRHWSDREESQNGFFSPKRPIFLLAWATYSELPFNVSTMVCVIAS